MATVHGKAADLVLGVNRLQSVFKEASTELGIDIAEVTPFGTNFKEFVAGQGAATVTLNGFYDTVLSVPVRATFFSDSNVLTLGPGGLNVGELARLIDAQDTNYTESAAVGDAIMASVSVQSTAEVGLGHSYRSPGDVAVTATGNGTSVDLAAAVSGAIWQFHAHLLTFTGATSIQIVMQDSADDVAFADIAGATTAVLTAADAFRITGTGTVRRFVRARHVVVGGTVSATYAAAFARR